MAQGQTALIVDDDERIAEMVSVMIRLEGVDVRTARNGLQDYSSHLRNPTDWSSPMWKCQSLTVSRWLVASGRSTRT